MKKIILTLALISGIGAPSIFTFVPCATAQVLGGEGPRARQSGLRGDVLDVNLRNPGTLEDCITPSEMDRVRCIRLSGSINGDDIRFIRKVCDRSSAVDEGGKKVSNYVDLELEHVRIVGGGRDYSYRTEHDVIGKRMFSSLSTLRNVTLPRGLRRIENNAFSSCNNLQEVYFTGRELRSIGDDAFQYCSRLSRINLPDGLESIGNGCFYGCDNLKRIDLPYSLQSIGNEAFSGTALNDIRLPRNLTYLGTNALKGTNIRSLLLPDRVAIEKDAPGRMPKLREFLVERGNPYYTTEDGVLYDNSGTKLLNFPAGKDGNINVPDGVKAIANGAFMECRDITAVSLPSSLITIGAQAFEGCTGLRAINIPADVEIIGERAFYNCRKLEGLSIEGPVKELLGRTFQDCSSLRSIILPNELIRIGESAFESCESLRSLEGANSLLSIGRYAFKKCGFVELALPSSVTTIDENAFRDCKALVSITLPASLKALSKEMFRGCESLEQLDMSQLPDLREIGENAVRDCKRVNRIMLPEGLTTIGNNAFRGTAITTLTLPASIHDIGEKIVEKCKMESITCLSTMPPVLKKLSDKKTQLHVPAGSVEAYKQAKSWKDFKNIDPIN